MHVHIFPRCPYFAETLPITLSIGKHISPTEATAEGRRQYPEAAMNVLRDDVWEKVCNEEVHIKSAVIYIA